MVQKHHFISICNSELSLSVESEFCLWSLKEKGSPWKYSWTKRTQTVLKYHFLMECIPQNLGPREFSRKTYAAVKGQFQSSEVWFNFWSLIWISLLDFQSHYSIFGILFPEKYVRTNNFVDKECTHPVGFSAETFWFAEHLRLSQLILS